MRAWQYIAPGKPLTLGDVDEPAPGRNDVLIEVKACGICHTDIGFLDGVLPLPHSPTTLGHEIAGVVADVGPEVEAFRPGDRVAVLARPEGPGTERDGGFQRLVTAQKELVVAVPDDVPWDQAAVSTDAGATSYHAVVTRGRLRAGERVAVIGMGGLGSLGVQTAIGAGAEVYVVDRSPEVADYAKQLGAAATATDVREFADVGLDLVCDFVGLGVTVAAAVDAARHGGRVVLVGLGERLGSVDLQSITLKHLDVLGSLGGTVADNAEVLSLMSRGNLLARTETVTFDETGQALERLRAGDVTGRLVVQFE